MKSKKVCEFNEHIFIFYQAYLNYMLCKNLFYIEQKLFLYRAKNLLYRAKIHFIPSIQFAPFPIYLVPSWERACSQLTKNTASGHFFRFHLFHLSGLPILQVFAIFSYVTKWGSLTAKIGKRRKTKFGRIYSCFRKKILVSFCIKKMNWLHC